MNCATTGVVYLLTCVCGGFYVGKTTRALVTRVREHYRDILTGNLDRPLGRHAAFRHGYKHINIQVKALDHVHSNPRGGDVDKAMLRLETRWIYDLKATVPPGLNDYISYGSFLEK